MAAKKKAGQDISELQKDSTIFPDINIQAADGSTASLMAKTSSAGDEAYTKALRSQKSLRAN